MISVSVKAVVFFLASLNIANLPNKFQINFDTPIATILPLSSATSNSEHVAENTNKTTDPPDCKPDLTESTSQLTTPLPEQAYLNCVKDFHSIRNKKHPDIGKSTVDSLV